MKIKLKKLTLLNFKGIRSLEIEFSQITNILGENATGKTSVFDAFLWLLFGKDSTDRKDFEIKTLDPNNKPFHRMDHEVTAILEVDGEELVLKRVFKENWTKKRGSSEAEFSGHTTSYFWNDIPLKLEEYQSKISAILQESIFKLITNTGYFNSLKWQERRNVLLQIAGKIDDKVVLDKIATLQNKDAIAKLTAAVNSKKSMEEYRRELGAKKKKIKDELELLPSRIDEASRSLPDIMDYTQIEAAISQLNLELENTEKLMLDKTHAQNERQKEISQKYTVINEHKNNRQQIEFEIKNRFQDKKRERSQQIVDVKRELNQKKDELARISADYIRLETRKKEIISTQDSLRAQWGSVNGETLEFKEAEFKCPTCKREYDSTDIESKKAELLKNFNQNKSIRLAEISAKGKALTLELKDIEEKMTTLAQLGKTTRQESDELAKSLEGLELAHNESSNNEALEIQRMIASDENYISLGNKIKILEEEVNLPQSDNSADLIQQKRSLNEKIQQLRKDLDSKEQRERIEKRIQELQVQEKEMATELAGLEGVEFTIEQFTKAKMDELETRINSRFKTVKFKLFEEQINGGQVECCEALINGVPYSDANTASKINAGLDVINTLCKHYDAYAPVFVDNAESVNTLIPVNAQLIRLVVSKDKKLKIETQKDLFSSAAVA